MKTEDQLNENSIVVKGLDPGQVRFRKITKIMTNTLEKTLGGGISKITKIMTNTMTKTNS